MRMLKTAVVVMGLLLVVGFFTLIVMIAGRFANKQKPAEPAAASFAGAPIELPLGARIETMAVGSERLVLDLLLANGDRQLLIIDLASGRKLGTIPLTSIR